MQVSAPIPAALRSANCMISKTFYGCCAYCTNEQETWNGAAMESSPVTFDDKVGDKVLVGGFHVSLVNGQANF